MDLFTGVGVALVTLLDDAGGVDAAATGSLAADLVSRGMQAVLACGTTGEPGTLTDAERLEVITAVRDAVPPGVPVLAGTGATSLARASELTAAAVAALTVYDMTKALDKSTQIQDLYLLEKTGGKSGDFRR